MGDLSKYDAFESNATDVGRPLSFGGVADQVAAFAGEYGDDVRTFGDVTHGEVEFSRDVIGEVGLSRNGFGVTGGLSGGASWDLGDGQSLSVEGGAALTLGTESDVEIGGRVTHTMDHGNGLTTSGTLTARASYQDGISALAGARADYVDPGGRFQAYGQVSGGIINDGFGTSVEGGISSSLGEVKGLAVDAFGRAGGGNIDGQRLSGTEVGLGTRVGGIRLETGVATGSADLGGAGTRGFDAGGEGARGFARASFSF